MINVRYGLTLYCQAFGRSLEGSNLWACSRLPSAPPLQSTQDMGFFRHRSVVNRLPRERIDLGHLLPWNASTVRGCGTHTATNAITRDKMFKVIFQDIKDASKAEGFYNALAEKHGTAPLERPVQLTDRTYEPLFKGMKKTMADVAFEDKNKIVTIEMQKAPRNGEMKRWQYYGARSYVAQGQTEYYCLKTVHVVSLVDYEHPYANETYALRGLSSGKRLSDSNLFTILSLHEVPEELTPDSDLLTRWLYLIKYSGRKRLYRELFNVNDALHQAFLDCKTSNQDSNNQSNEAENKGLSYPWLKRTIRDKTLKMKQDLHEQRKPENQH